MSQTRQYFSELEKSIITELVAKHKNVIEAKRNDYKTVPFVNGPMASVVFYSLRVGEYSLSAELHLLGLRRHSLSASVSKLLEYGR